MTSTLHIIIIWDGQQWEGQCEACGEVSFVGCGHGRGKACQLMDRDRDKLTGIS